VIPPDGLLLKRGGEGEGGEKREGERRGRKRGREGRKGNCAVVNFPLKNPASQIRQMKRNLHSHIYTFIQNLHCKIGPTAYVMFYRN